MNATTSGSQGRKSVMTTWASTASTAVGSIFKKERNGNFGALEKDENAGADVPLTRSQSRPELSRASSLSRSRSGQAAPPPPRSRAQSTHTEARSSKHSSPRAPPRSLTNSEKASPPKLMRALFSFTGANDELSMETGDEITVLSEPYETWWMGECKGLKGLFPVNYTEEIPRKPPLPMRPATLVKSGQSQPSSPVQNFPVIRARSNSANVVKSSQPDWRDEPFGDHHSALASIAHSPDYRQTTHSGGEDDEDDRRGLVTGTTSSPTRVRQLTRSFSGKKAPPPPPSRRLAATSTHKVPPSNGNGSSNSPFLTPTTLSNKSWHANTPQDGGSARDYESSKSPFDEGDGDLEDSASFSAFSLTRKCHVCSCDDFQQNLFKENGFCNSCFHEHP